MRLQKHFNTAATETPASANLKSFHSACGETLLSGQVRLPPLIAVVGGGPAGLRAAEVCASAGLGVVLFDAKRSVGRKFLVAGKGGLNITNTEPEEVLVQRYSGKTPEFWRGVLGDFDSGNLREWALQLGFETFATKSGRVYLKDLKAAGLLRRWVARLREAGWDEAAPRPLFLGLWLVADAAPAGRPCPLA
jgi:glycine/D-amino acid oxidase-like deaminating enzyme